MSNVYKNIRKAKVLAKNRPHFQISSASPAWEPAYFLMSADTQDENIKLVSGDKMIINLVAFQWWRKYPN